MAFLQRIRIRCAGHGGEPTGDAWHIDKLAATTPAATSLDEVMAAGGDGKPAQIAAALGWLQSCGSRVALVARFRGEAMPRVLEEHQIKHPAAAFEEAELAGNWADSLAACAFHYGFERFHPPWSAYAATVDALQ